MKAITGYIVNYAYERLCNKGECTHLQKSSTKLTIYPDNCDACKNLKIII